MYIRRYIYLQSHEHQVPPAIIHYIRYNVRYYFTKNIHILVLLLYVDNDNYTILDDHDDGTLDKDDKLVYIKGWYNTLVQHCKNVIQMFSVCWKDIFF